MIKLGMVGEALRQKIKEKNQLYTQEELEYLLQQGYSPRGTGFASTESGKFVSTKMLDEMVYSRRADATVIRAATDDPVLKVVRSIHDSISSFVDVIIENSEKKVDAVKETATPPAGAEAATDAKADDIPIFKKFKKLFALGAVLLLQVAYPIYNIFKAAFQKISEWIGNLKEVFGKVLSFFTETIPSFIDDVKKFFTETIPDYFGRFMTAAKESIDGLLAFPAQIIDKMKSFVSDFIDNVIGVLDPFLSRLGIKLKPKEVPQKGTVVPQRGTAPAAPAPAGPPVSAVPAAPPPAVSGAPSKAASAAEARPSTTSSTEGRGTMIQAMDDAKITDPVQRAAIMAQVGVESGGFKTLSENLNYRPSTLLKVFPKYFRSEEDAAITAGAGPEAIANKVYGGRMGNAPDEGFKYRGRGFIQLTGKDNYKRFGYDSNPDQVATSKVGAETAIKYMMGYKGDWGDVKAVTKFVNGGYHGLEQRQKQFQEYLNDPEITAGGNGTQVASATKAADIRPTKQSIQMAAAGPSAAPPPKKEKGEGSATSPNPTSVTNAYKGYFAVA